jgi:hypothetical protein
MRQSQVQTLSAPAVAGDFASSDPRAAALAGPGGLIAGGSGRGLEVGVFAWLLPDPADVEAPRILVNTQQGGRAPDCFIHREQAIGSFEQLRDEHSMFIPPGVQCGGMTTGAYWAKVHMGTAAVGMKAYAETATGKVQFRAAGTVAAGLVETKWWACSAGGTGDLVKISDVKPS